MKKIIAIAALFSLMGCSLIPTAAKVTPAAAPLALLEAVTEQATATPKPPPEQIKLSANHNSGSIVISIYGPATAITGEDPTLVTESPPTPVLPLDPMQAIKDEIKGIEGLKLTPYTDTSGTVHIGYGRNLDTRGITEAEAEIMFEADFMDSLTDLREKLLNDTWPDLPQGIQSVLINMRFQLGHGGFRGFGEMITAVQEHNWPAMVTEMKTSL